MSLTNEQYNQIMAVYDDRQYERRSELSRRKQKLYAKLPRIRQIEDEIRRMAIEEVKNRLGSRGAEGESAPRNGREAQTAGEAAGTNAQAPSGEHLDRIAALREEKSRLLKENGFSEDFLDVPYACPDCRDTGYAGGQRCHCFLQLSLDLFGDSHSGALVGLSLGDFSLEYYPAALFDEQTGRSSLELAQAALSRARVFVSQFDTSFENILLIGKTGTGKTHLSTCIGGELLSAGHTVCYLTAFELFAILKKEAFSREDVRSGEYERLFTCELLIIDDLGTEFMTAMTNSQLFELVNERIRRKVSTLISTNLEMPSLGEVYTERMLSRFVEYYIPLKLQAPDIRMQKKGVTG